jgi:hypothetical protein
MTSIAGLDNVCGVRCVASAVIPSRSSSKQEIERKPTTASMPSVSNCHGRRDGLRPACAATPTSATPMTLLSMSAPTQRGAEHRECAGACRR